MRYATTALAVFVLMSFATQGSAAPTDGLSSEDFAFRYEMDAILGTQNLDGVGGGDWFNGVAGGVTQPSVAGGLGISNQAATNPEVLWRTDFGNSLSRAAVTGDFTIDMSLRLIPGANDAGDVGKFGFALQQPGQGQSLRLNVDDANVSFNGGGVGSIATGSNTDAQHAYRIAFEGGNNYWVWRDGVLLNANLATPFTGSNGNFNNSGAWFLGDFSGSLSGEFEADYIRVTPGSFAPAAAVASNGAQVQLGFDFTSGSVASQNEGVVVDDSGSGNPFEVRSGNPTYSSNLPAAGLIQTSQGIGSVDLSGGNNTLQSIASVGTTGITEQAVIDAGGITIEAWVNQSASTARGVILSIGDAFNLESRPGEFVLLTNSSGNPTPSFAISEADKNLDQWLHLAGVFTVGPGANDNTSALYVNGELADIETGLSFEPVFDAVANRHITLGNAFNFNFDFEGLVFEPRVTLGALEPGQFLITPEPASILVWSAMALFAVGIGWQFRHRRIRSA